LGAKRSQVQILYSRLKVVMARQTHGDGEPFSLMRQGVSRLDWFKRRLKWASNFRSFVNSFC
ncbi:MAG: hypothetical protein NT138_27800, partial [Planctomycetales bacterium]|nr:hypothetical protein [Planctomycetales bacterium]